jgi:pimeloyl-ACP methyl ester carboxylesterase
MCLLNRDKIHIAVDGLNIFYREAGPKDAPTLVVWGKYDASFTVAGATAYGRDVPDAETHLLEAGHFALDEAADEIAARIDTFLSTSGIGKRG